MTKALLLAGLLMAIPAMSRADDLCANKACQVQIGFVSASEQRQYGLLIAAPKTGCRRVRFRVIQGSSFLGQTPPLEPGGSAVVRLGRGFRVGPVLVTVRPIGCDIQPAALRRVTLAKLAPDHGWRASRELALR